MDSRRVKRVSRLLPPSFDEQQGLETRQNASRDLLLPPSTPASPPPGPETCLGPWFLFLLLFFHLHKARDASRALFSLFFPYFFLVFTIPRVRDASRALVFLFLHLKKARDASRAFFSFLFQFHKARDASRALFFSFFLFSLFFSSPQGSRRVSSLVFSSFFLFFYLNKARDVSRAIFFLFFFFSPHHKGPRRVSGTCFSFSFLFFSFFVFLLYIFTTTMARDSSRVIVFLFHYQGLIRGPNDETRFRHLDPRLETRLEPLVRVFFIIFVFFFFF
jgi:hypothetical protein